MYFHSQVHRKGVYIMTTHEQWATLMPRCGLYYFRLEGTGNPWENSWFQVWGRKYTKWVWASCARKQRVLQDLGFIQKDSEVNLKGRHWPKTLSNNKNDCNNLMHIKDVRKCKFILIHVYTYLIGHWSPLKGARNQLILNFFS